MPSSGRCSAWLARRDLVLLVKPQFEAGRAEADRGRGVIAEAAGCGEDALDGVIDALVVGGATIMGAMVSPLRGASGNVEFLLWATTVPDATAPPLWPRRRPGRRGAARVR
ncbi:MAG: hypothetical protein U5R31_10735 [Acidimicrobiia bacterium]|nr:hypothetical protein [Acidimicrobiia bacterium]